MRGARGRSEGHQTMGPPSCHRARAVRAARTHAARVSTHAHAHAPQHTRGNARGVGCSRGSASTCAAGQNGIPPRTRTQPRKIPGGRGLHQRTQAQACQQRNSSARDNSDDACDNSSDSDCNSTSGCSSARDDSATVRHAPRHTTHTFLFRRPATTHARAQPVAASGAVSCAAALRVPSLAQVRHRTLSLRVARRATQRVSNTASSGAANAPPAKRVVASHAQGRQGNAAPCTHTHAHEQTTKATDQNPTGRTNASGPNSSSTRRPCAHAA